MSALNVVLLLAAVACPGGAIRCYTCNSVQDQYCANPMDRSRLQTTECTMDIVQRGIEFITTKVQGGDDRMGTQLFPHGDTTLVTPMVCQKIDLIGIDGRNATLRSCSLKDTQHGDLCQDFKGKNSFQRVAYCGVCDEDGCNGAGRPGSAWLAPLPLLLATLMRLRG